MIVSNKLSKIFLGIFLSIIFLVVSIFFQYSIGSVLFKTKLFSVNSALFPKIAFANNYLTSACMGSDVDGYLKIPITFTADFTMSYRYNSGYYGSGDSTSCYTIITGTSSLFWQQRMLIPEKPADMDWLPNQTTFYSFEEGETVYFYVVKSDWFPENGGDEMLYTNENLDTDDYIGISGNQCGQTNWSNDPIVYW